MTVKALLNAQPWRSGTGLPRNALDPKWDGQPSDWCAGTPEHTGDGSWWYCSLCGYVSDGTFVQHKPIKHPQEMHGRAWAKFIQNATAQGLSTEDAVNKALYVMSVALWHASTKKPEEILEMLHRLLHQT